ncbi:NAD(P)H-hydrate epimerase [Microbacterium sp.]|uniref:NAD(P)H-hydrate epimerase n=1 Tax=Microbacterium sp. TaxID=51671 RepID=UPI0037C9377D
MRDDDQESSTVKLYTAAQVREAERPLLDAGEPLMMRAAEALAVVVSEELERGPVPARVLVLAGSGNNGGDALFAVARLGRRHAIDVLPVGTAVHEAGLAAAVAGGAHVIDAAEAEDAEYDLVLDGVLGTGTTGAPTLRGIVRGVVEQLLPAVESGRTKVVAVDLPSGLHPDEGTTADGLVLPATVTVTFGGVKAGLTRGDGPRLAGRVVLVDIGLGERLAAIEPVGEASIDRIVTRT